MQKNDPEIIIMDMSHLNEIKNILITDFDDFWNYDVFKSELNNPNSIYFALLKENEIIGFGGILVIIDLAEITNIVIKKTYRNNRFFKTIVGTYHKILQRA